jgi:hypothetical protein
MRDGEKSLDGDQATATTDIPSPVAEKEDIMNTIATTTVKAPRKTAKKKAVKKTAKKKVVAAKSKSNGKTKKAKTNGNGHGLTGYKNLHREGSNKGKAHELFDKAGGVKASREDLAKVAEKIVKLGIQKTTVTSWFSYFRTL